MANEYSSIASTELRNASIHESALIDRFQNGEKESFQRTCFEVPGKNI